MKADLPILRYYAERCNIAAVDSGDANPITGDITIAYRPFPNTPFEEKVKNNISNSFTPKFVELTDGWKP